MTRILVVEDELVVRNLMREILEEAGYAVTPASDAAAAMEALDRDAISLVLSDIIMPGLSGLELLSHIRSRRPSLPVVLMTAAGTYEHLTQALAGGADGLVTKPFSHAELKAAVVKALDRARQSERELRDRLLTPTLASALANAIEARDGEADGHCERIARLATRLALELGLDHTEVEAARLGAILHDVGKIRIPDRVLLKGKPYAAEELAIMRTHPLVGDELLASLDLLSDVRAAVRHHHERWDGAGYPDGLAGEGIPLVARIVAVADAVESMSARRAHRDALSRRALVAELRKGRGGQWDPRLTDIVVDLIRAGQLVFTPEGFDVIDYPPSHQDRALFSVLLVEDDPTHASLAIEALESELDDVKVVHVRDIASASELCKGSMWSLVLLDHQLPDGTGLALLETLRGAAPDLPIVMLTGTESLAVEAFRKGASDYVVKTRGYLDELTGRVRVLMDRA